MSKPNARTAVNREYRERLERVLREHGIHTFRYEPRGSTHMALVFEHGGKTLSKAVPSTPSDKWFGTKKAVAQLKRIIRTGVSQ